MDVWAQPMRFDQKWNNGDYYGKEPPLDGLKAALKIVTLQSNGWEWAQKTFGTAPAEEGKDPAKALPNEFKIDAFLDQAAVARAVLALYAPNDLIFYEPIVRETIQKISDAGASVETAALIGPNGHLNALTQIRQEAEKITTFLAR